MRCPYCGGLDTQVKDSRPTEDASSIRRRRVCPDCGGRFTTFERVQLRELMVVKRNGRRVPFDRDKLQRSVDVALRKRAVAPERVERMINGIVRQLESQGDADIPTERIGELVMEGLKGLDDVAYVRFASVYRNFREARDFNAIVGELSGEPEAEPGPDEREPAAARAGAMNAARDDDERWMAAALRFGRRNFGLTAPNPCVAAMIVSDGALVGRGVTAPGGRPHAEAVALAEAGEAARGATMYVTLEPCSHTGATPPCADAIVAAGVARVVCGARRPRRARRRPRICEAARTPGSRSKSARAQRRRGATISAIFCARPSAGRW